MKNQIRIISEKVFFNSGKYSQIVINLVEKVEQLYINDTVTYEKSGAFHNEVDNLLRVIDMSRKLDVEVLLELSELLRQNMVILDPSFREKDLNDKSNNVDELNEVICPRENGTMYLSPLIESSKDVDLNKQTAVEWLRTQIINQVKRMGIDLNIDGFFEEALIKELNQREEDKNFIKNR